MAEFNNQAIRWPGSGSAVTTASISYGYYLNEPGMPTASGTGSIPSIGSFEYDCLTSAKWAATRLGYPIVEIEMIDINFYSCFEEAVNEYGAQVNQFNIRNNLLNLQGMNVSQSISGLHVNSSGLAFFINIAKDYGSYIGIGGNVDVKKAPLQLSASQQTYDLQVLIANVSESGNRLDIRRVFHGPPPAFARIYDPFSMTGMSYGNVLNEMGFAGYSPATQFLMTPIFEDLLRGQAIEFNDMVRKSGYSFEITNNKLKIFPIPTYNHTIYVEYVVEKDLFAPAEAFTSGSNYDIVSDYSNIPYQEVRYNKLNAVGRQWIKKYFLALCKETLGRILSKYSTTPIPGGEVTLDGNELRSEATAEKEVLMTQLRENLDVTGREKMIESKSNEAEKMRDTLRSIPMMIYIA
jgi:hypothetical protein